MALSALINISKSNDFYLAENLYLNDKNAAIKKAAAVLLHKTSNIDNWETAYRLLKNSVLPRERKMACELFCRFAESVSLEEINYFLNDSDGHVRKFANHLLSH